MDPITLILAALTAGAINGTKETASQAIKDTYDSLKSLIQGKFVNNPDAQLALTNHEQKPEVWEASVKDALLQVSADKDEEIIKAAQQLMIILNPKQAAIGKFNIQITGNIEGLVQGDNTRVTMNFGKKPQKKTKK